MNAKAAGAMIRAERLRRSWSQAGLCHGICAVSYLSKIERGEAAADAELMALLFERLEIEPHDDNETAQLIESCYASLFECDEKTLDILLDRLCERRATAERSLYRLDVLLLLSWMKRGSGGLPDAYADCMDVRQRTLFLLLKGDYEQALLLTPSSLTYMALGNNEYENGRNTAAVEHLSRAYELAAEEGYFHAMLNARMLTGNCYSNIGDYEHMLSHYAVAKRMAMALGESALYDSISYNVASTLLELGRVEEALRLLEALERPTAMVCHKLAVCYELMGEKDKAFTALERAESIRGGFPDDDTTREMCALVRFRLNDRDFIENEEYGKALTACFEKLRRELPIGYASFHLPWVIQWHKARRQYRQVCELMKDFPAQPRLTPDKRRI